MLTACTDPVFLAASDWSNFILAPLAAAIPTPAMNHFFSYNVLHLVSKFLRLYIEFPRLTGHLYPFCLRLFDFAPDYVLIFILMQTQTVIAYILRFFFDTVKIYIIAYRICFPLFYLENLFFFPYFTQITF